MTIETVNNVISAWTWNASALWACIVLVGTLIIAVFFQNNANEEKNTNLRIPLILIGGMIATAIFPYTVVRGANIAISGIDGRDSILIAFGMSLLFVGMFYTDRFRALLIFPVLLGIVFFGNQYLNYQREGYLQMGFQQDIQELELDKGVYVVNATSNSPIGDRRFYSWSGCAASVRERRDLLLLNGNGDRGILNTSAMSSIVAHYPMFTDFDISELDVKGNLLFDGDISIRETIKMKWMEMYNPKLFQEKIENLTSLKLTINE